MATTNARKPVTSNTPAVGEGANVFGYSDVNAFTVLAVSASGKRCTIQRDTATLLNGCNSGEPDALQFSPGGFVGHTSGTQRYSYARNTEGAIVTVSMRKTGEWRTAGRHGERVKFGERREHYDFNF